MTAIPKARMVLANVDQVIEASLSLSLPSALSGSSRILSSVSAYRRAPHPRWRRAPLGRSLGASSLNQHLVCNPLSGRPVNETVEPRQGIVLNVSLVQAEGKFVNVALKMLRAGMVINADQSRRGLGAWKRARRVPSTNRASGGPERTNRVHWSKSELCFLRSTACGKDVKNGPRRGKAQGAMQEIHVTAKPGAQQSAIARIATPPKRIDGRPPQSQKPSSDATPSGEISCPESRPKLLKRRKMDSERTRRARTSQKPRGAALAGNRVSDPALHRVASKSEAPTRPLGRILLPVNANGPDLRPAPPPPCFAWSPSPALTRRGGKAPPRLLPRAAIAKRGRGTTRRVVEGARRRRLGSYCRPEIRAQPIDIMEPAPGNPIAAEASGRRGAARGGPRARRSAG